MGGYLGSYLYQVDEKGRVTLPAAFRRDNEAQSFVLIQAQPDALTLYPDETWAGLHSVNIPSHNSLVQVASTGCGDCHSDPPPPPALFNA